MSSPLLQFEDAIEKDSPIETTPDNQKSIDEMKKNNNKVLEKVKQIGDLQLEIFELKHAGDDSFNQKELKKRFNTLKKYELELSLIRDDQYKTFKRLSDLRGEVSFSSAFGGRSSPSDQKKRTFSMRKPSNLHIDTPTRNRSASQNWKSLLNVAGAVQTWKDTWESSQKNKAQTALQSPVSKMTKDEILNLRKSLFRLKQKKRLDKEEELLRDSMMDRLKELNQLFHERKVETSTLTSADAEYY